MEQTPVIGYAEIRVLVAATEKEASAARAADKNKKSRFCEKQRYYYSCRGEWRFNVRLGMPDLYGSREPCIHILPMSFKNRAASQ